MGSSSSRTNYFWGAVDEVKFWSIARTRVDFDRDIKIKLFEPSPGLLAYWDCDEGEGNSIYPLEASSEYVIPFLAQESFSTS